MAKNDDELDDLDMIDFGDDFDLDSASLGEELNDRNPITRIPRKAGGAFIDATIGSENVRERIVRDSLPRAFQPTYRSARAIQSEVDKTLDHLDRELRDTKHDAKAAARALLPTMKPFLPAALTRKIDAFSKEDRGWNGGELDADSAEIAAALDGIFGSTQPRMTAEDQRNAQLEKTAEMVIEQEKTVKQDSMLQHIINIDDGLRGVVEGQAGTINYRRKALELQYRQYFTARDTLKAHGEAYEKIIPSLEAIAKNTALPDYAKEEFGEITAGLMKRNIIEKLSPLNWSRNYYKYVGEGFRNKISEMAGNARQAMSMASMMSGGFEDDPGGDITNEELRRNYMDQAAVIGGGVAGDLVTEKFMGPMTAKLQKMLLKNPGLMKVFSTVTSALDNPAAFIHGIDTSDSETNIALKGLRHLVDFAGARGPDNMDALDAAGETSATLAGAGKLTRKSIRALDHVIPNLLAKIDQSVRRIYNPKAALEMYDYERDKFVTVSAWQKRALASAQDDVNSSSLTNVVDGFLGDIRRMNSESQAGLEQINDPAKDIIKKAVEIAAKHNCYIFDPRQEWSDNPTPLGLDKVLLSELTDTEQALLISAFNDIFAAANQGVSEAVAEGRIYQLKTTFNQRARNHLGATTGRAARRVNELISIYGIGQVSETDLVWAKKEVTKTRPNYYLGKTLVIRADWFAKGAYSTTAGPLYSLRGCSSAIFGPKPDGKLGDRSVQLVGEQQLQYLRTQDGEHFETVERALDLNDGTVYRLNKSLNGTSQIHKASKDEVLGSDAAARFDSAEYTDEGEDEASWRDTSKSRKHRRLTRQRNRDAQRELESIQQGHKLTIGTLNAEMKGVETRLDLILSQLIANNVNDRLSEIKETIEKNATIVVNGQDLSPEVKDRLASIRGGLGRAGSTLGEWGRNTRKWVGERATAGREWLNERGVSLNPFKAAGKLIDTAISSAREMGRAVLGKRDILDKAGNVILSALDIQSKRLFSKNANGEYILITKISDIKGGVYRLSDDGETYNQVFSVEEIAAKYDELCYNTKTGLQKVVTDGAGWIGEKARAVQARLLSATGSAGAFVSKIGKAAWGALADIPDIYYSLDPEPRTPRLLARVAKENGYVDVKTGKPVRYFTDIHGEVRDLDGNTRISQSDFENPEGKFIDVDGNDVTSMMSSIASAGRQMRKRTLETGRAVYGWFQKAFETTKELGANMMGFMSSMLGRGGFVMGQTLVVDRLEHIYRLLNERLSGSGNSTPLPFEPMKPSGGGWRGGKPKGDAPEAPVAPEVDGEGNVVKPKPKTMYGQAAELMRNGKAKKMAEEKFTAAKEHVRTASAAAKGRLYNYTTAFKHEISKQFGFDPDLVYEKLMGDLQTTRERILSETGIDQAMLDLALLDGEFKNVYSQYQRGEISKADYQAKLREMAAQSPYKDVYHKTMGVLGKAAQAAAEKARKVANEKTEAAKEFAGKQFDKVMENPRVKGIIDSATERTDAVRTALAGIFSKATGILKPKDAAALEEALTELETVPVNERDEGWFAAVKKITAKLNASREAELAEGKKGKHSILDSVGELGGKFLEWRRGRTKLEPEVAKSTIDGDGDGLRDGSFAAKAKKKAEDIAQKGFFKNMADAFGGVFGATKGTKKEGGGILSKVMGFLAPMMGKMVFELFKGPFGILTMLKFAGQMLLGGGKFLGSMALSSASAIGGAAMRYAITPALGMAGSALGAGAGALAGLAVNPMTWAVVGTAAAAYGIYKTYKWATADRIPVIDQLRVATYGAEDYSRLDLTDVQKTLFLEDAVREYVSYDQNGRATINKMSGQQVFTMIQGWGIDPKDQEQVTLFMQWFQQRFLPVYSIWLSAAKQYLNVDKLKDIGNEKSFTVESKLKLAKATRLSKDSPIWSVVTGPYNDTDMLEFDEVDELFADTIEDWTEAMPRARTEAETFTGRSTSYGPAPKPGEASAPKEDRPEFELKDRKRYFSFGDSAGNSDELDGRDMFTSKVSSVQGYMPKDDGFRHVKDGVDALTAVRLRLYGCWDLTTQNVNNAYAIEDLVYPELKHEDKQLTYGGDLKVLYEKLRGMGGLRPNYDFSDFKNWFNRLFLPVFSAYIGAVNLHLKASDPLNIKPNGGDKGFLIAKAMWGAPTRFATLAKPPFRNDEIDDLELATDYMEASMASLEKLQRAYKVKEEASQKATMPNAPTAAQARVLESTGGKYTLDKNGKVVLTQKGQQESIAPWKRGNTAGPGGDTSGPASVWGEDISESDAHAGGGKVTPPRPSPKRDEAEKLLIAAAIKAGITDPTEIAMLLAQAAHESGGFKSIEENLNYSSDRLLQIFPKYFNPAMAQKYARDPVAIANIAYGKRMGNKDPGDGYKYRGRGFMQLTGRSNYEALAKKYPQAKDPNWVATPEGAAASAVYFWTNIASGALRQRAQGGDVLGATRIVNGGTNGLADRRNEFGFYMKKIKSGELPIDATSAQPGETESEGPATASAAREEGPSGPATNSIDVMSAGAGKDSPETIAQTEVSKSVSKVPDRASGTPEQVAERTTAAAVKSAQPSVPTTNPAPGRPTPPPVVPTTPAARAEDVEREQTSTVKRAKENELLKPIGDLVELARNQLEVQKAILSAIASGGGGTSTPQPAPISMAR